MHPISPAPTVPIPELMRRFAPYLLRSRRPAGETAVLTFLQPLTAGAALWLVTLLIDEVFVAGRMDLLPTIMAIYFALLAVKCGLDYRISLQEASVMERIAQDLRLDLYSHLLSLSPGSLGSRGIGDLLTHLSGDVRRVEALIFTGPLTAFADLTGALFFLCFLLIMSWKLTLCALLIVPLLALASIRFSPIVRRSAKLARSDETRWMSRAEERLGAAPVVHAFGAGAMEAAAFSQRSARAYRSEMRTAKLQARLSLLVEGLAALGGLLVILVGAYEMQAGHLTLGTFVAFLGAIGSLYGPTRGLAKIPALFQRAAASAARVAQLLDLPSRVVERPSAKPLTGMNGALAFHNVSFGYPGGETVLDDISLSVEPGEMVAIVGPSGSGKSTLAQLALRLYDPIAGSVRLDGTDLRDITLDSLRRAVAVVFQDAHIFRGTITENLRYGRPDAPSEAVAAAARTAHVDSFVTSLRGGYATQAGARGGWLSGGQRQRIALARALLREPAVLILDEATAAVDSEAEELIQDAVERLAGRRTMIVIGHRLSSIRRADRVLVLDKGRIVEEGTPESLLAAGSRYRDLFAAQLSHERAVA